jgi:phytoene dehydrogenase-like protein
MAMRIGEPWRPGAAREPWDAIVIGSGIGGLAAAALLARHGKRRVLVLERHYTAGGFTHVFHRPGYEWDVGVHYVGDTSPGCFLRRLFDDVTDGALDWADMGEIYDRVVMGGEVYDFPRGRAGLEAALGRHFPTRAPRSTSTSRSSRDGRRPPCPLPGEGDAGAARAACPPFAQRRFRSSRPARHARSWSRSRATSA